MKTALFVAMRPALNLEIVKPPPKWRTLLILGRVSNVPTVWSNCFAGWWLGGGGSRIGLAAALCGITFLYLGGMFLNDAFDAEFDRRHRKLRPIPSGGITEKEVGQWGVLWFTLGAAALVWTGTTAAVLAITLVLCILVYNAGHKWMSFAPALVSACRLLIYLTAAAAGGAALSGRVIWPAIALAFYVAGLSCLARKESVPGRPELWPVALLIAPIALSALVSDQGRMAAVGVSVLLALWVAWALAQTFGRDFPRVGVTVSRLLAGIALVDLLAAGQASHGAVWGFVALFGAAIFLQRFVPAT